MEIEKRTKMKTYSNISFPSKVRFRKKVHSQTSDHVWFFLNLFSKRPREKKRKKEKKIKIQKLQNIPIGMLVYQKLY